MTPTGWYPDPSGRWEARWWDGQAWSPRVATGLFATDEPYPAAPATPTDESVAFFDVEGTYEREPMRLRLTWSFITLVPTRRPQETRWIPLQFVAGLSAEQAATADAPGNIRLSIRGAGYVGPGLYLLTGVPNAHWVRALVLRQRAIITGIPATTG